MLPATMYEPRPGGRCGQLLTALNDGEIHTTEDLRQSCGFSKGTLSSAMHRLRFFHGYMVEATDVGDHLEYKLMGRRSQHPHLPVPGTVMEVRSVALTEGEKIEVVFQEQDRTQWTMVLQRDRQ